MAVIGGGFKAVKSVWYYSRQIGLRNLWQTLRSKNACKACAFGTGGQNGGIHNETGKGIEFCNKNIQAHLNDVRPAIPATFFFERSIQQLAKLPAQQLEALGRLSTPLHKKAGDTHYTTISYTEAFEIAAKRFQEASADKTFFYASGRSSNEAAYILQLLARCYGTNNVNNCSYYCHQASGVALSESIGGGTATIQFDDLEKADLVFVFGANPASNHPRFVKTLLKIRRNGGRVVVINPAKEAGMVRFASPSDWRSMLKGGETVADLYIQPHLSGDIALMHGIAKYILIDDALDHTFLEDTCEGFEQFRAQVESLDWSEIEKNSGVERSVIREAAKLYRSSQATVFCWSMGLTHHLHGVKNIQSLVNLALMRGMVGKPGAGLLPLRGHSNIQGTGSMGFTPKLKHAIESALEQKLGQALPQTPGMDTMACMEASEAGNIQCAFMLGGNLLASNPDHRYAVSALNNIPFKLFLNPTLNISHLKGVDGEVLILPIRARDEERQSTTQESMFNFVRLSNGGIDRFPHLKSEVEIIVEIAKSIIPKNKFDFSQLENHNTIRQWIAQTIPGFKLAEQISQTKIEFHIEGRVLHTPRFSTPSGKAQFLYHSAPIRKENTFLLTSVRSEGQFNSIIYHEFDSYREQTERHVLLMNPNDIEQLGLEENQLVNISSASGRLEALKVRPFDIRPGNVMTYYPEANVLVPKAVDEASRTPAFKSVHITIETRLSTGSNGHDAVNEYAQ